MADGDVATANGKVYEALHKLFGHKCFKSELQERAVNCALKKKQDVYVSMPTGSGKSLCFQLPGLMCENQLTIVFSPLLALIKDQIDHLAKLKVRADSLNSKMSTKERDNVIMDLKSVKPTIRFLYITPEQAATKTFQHLLHTLVQHNKVAYFAVDEAHCVSQWGHDFRPDYLKLGELRAKYMDIVWLALTATASRDVREDIYKQLHLRPPIAKFTTPSFRPNLYYDIVYKNSIEDDFQHLAAFALHCLGNEQEFQKTPKAKRGCGIIYCRTRENVERVAMGVSKQGVGAVAYHAGLKTAERTQVQEAWMRGEQPIICATNSFGMGVDKPSVRFVIHWDVPQNVAAYYQESGRAGRDGLQSYCRLYYGRDDVKSIRFLLQNDANRARGRGDKELLTERAIRQFEKIVDFCEALRCRHKLFADYFGDPAPECVNQCDICKDPKRASKALDMFQRLCMDATFKSHVSLEDCADLYEGGRAGSKRVAQDYADEDDSDGDAGVSHAQMAKRAKKESEDFIRKQFQLRKQISAARQLEQETSTQIARVKHAQSTTNKIAGLQHQQRETYLSTIIEALKTNVKSAETEQPRSALRHRDYEAMAVDMEYEVFKQQRVASIYRHTLAKQLSIIKQLSNKGQLMPLIADYVPRPETAEKGAWTGGSVAYFERKLQELEAQRPNALKEVPKALRERKSFKEENVRQTTIGSYFNKIKTESSEEEAINIKMEPKDSGEEEEAGEQANAVLDGRLNGNVKIADATTSENKLVETVTVKQENNNTNNTKTNSKQSELQIDTKYKLMPNEDGTYDTHRKIRVSHKAQHQQNQQKHDLQSKKPQTIKLFTEPVTDELELRTDESSIKVEESEDSKRVDTDLTDSNSIELAGQEKPQQSHRKTAEPQAMAGFMTARQMLDVSKEPSDHSNDALRKAASNKEKQPHHKASGNTKGDFATARQIMEQHHKQKIGASSRQVQKAKALDQQKNDVSKSVVEWLNPYYKRKIATRELFKALAKLLTQRICDGTLAGDGGKCYIKETFHNLEMIANDDDIEKHFARALK
ncbi:ATP-dependent DNA helicase Q5 isoform X2 [Scaptodrosophila lebanonensis]|uniref:ATP-dependent DNA helicase Q5 n=1 Tax=Drosophila lebanonensis TaxID=7225 RepID=A0A6J2UD16_DROLE|nr:ATP-dependent DNA helicase Q5 isoform X2 [Scaptodrosophila lebanonensis]